MLHFRQNEGDSSILVSNFYINKCHTKCKHWEKLDELYRREKEKGNGIYVISTNPKLKISYVCTEHEVAFMWCIGQCRKKIPYSKRHHEWVDMFLIFQLMIVSRLYLG